MLKLLPSHNKEELGLAAHYISNSLNNEVQTLQSCGRRTRTQTAATTPSTATTCTADSEELAPTLQSELSNHKNDVNSIHSEPSPTAMVEADDTISATCVLDDSITELKQSVVKHKQIEPTLKDKNCDLTSTKSVKISDQVCTDDCKFKSKQKSKKLKMTRCNFCLKWFHDECVNIPRSEPDGFWLCFTCRKMPDELQCLSQSITALHECTREILTQITAHNLSTQRNFDSINDRLTSITNRLTTNDKTASDQLCVLKQTTESLKSDINRKHDALLSKTQIIIDHVKSTEKQSHLRQLSQFQSTTQNTVAEAKADPPPSPYSQTTDRPVTTLLTGSSILKGIKTRGLSKGVRVKTLPGAQISDLHKSLRESDLENTGTVILHIGGNDASNNKDPDIFVSDFRSLVSWLSNKVQVIVSGLTPRADVDVTDYDLKIRDLCAGENIPYIDNRSSFTLTTGNLPRAYFHRDNIHLSDTGTSVLLHNIHGVHPILKSNNPQERSTEQAPYSRRGYDKQTRHSQTGFSSVRNGRKANYSHYQSRLPDRYPERRDNWSRDERQRHERQRHKNDWLEGSRRTSDSRWNRQASYHVNRFDYADSDRQTPRRYHISRENRQSLNKYDRNWQD